MNYQRKKYNFLIIRILFIFIISFFCQCRDNLDVSPEQELAFAKFYGGTYINEIQDIKPTTDGYVLLGTIELVIDEKTTKITKDIYLIKTNKKGNSIWTNTYGDIETDEVGKSMVINDKDEIFITGTKTFNSNYSNVIVMKIDKEGNQIQYNLKDFTREWEQKTADTMLLSANCINPTFDGGFIITGFTTLGNDLNQNPAGNKDLLLIKINSKLNVVWFTQWGGNGNEIGNYVVAKNENTFLITGETDTDWKNDATRKNIVFLEMDAESGIPKNFKPYGDKLDDSGYYISILNDGNYIITGYTTTSDRGEQAFVKKISSDVGNNLIWEKFFGDNYNDRGKYLIETQNNELAIVGIYGGYENTNPQIYFIKTDANGNEIASVDHGSADGQEEGTCILETQDGGFIITGNTFYQKNQMGVMIKTNSTGEISE